MALVENVPVLLGAIGSSAEEVPIIEKPVQKLPVGLVFPGQGAQSIGMLSKAAHLPAVQALIKEANEVLGYDILQLCTEGPLEKLKQTRYCQPAIFVASLAAVEMLRAESPEKVNNCKAVAGFSLGEVTALVFSGVVSLKDGLELVKIRAEAMDAATKVGGSQLMVSVVGFARTKVEDVISEVKAQFPGTVLQIANELFSTGFTCSGNGDAINALAAAVKARSGMATILPTSGAFHTPMMEPALETLTAACAKLVPAKGNCLVYSNTIAKPYDSANQETSFLELLPKQIVSPVLWDTLVRQMIADGVTDFIEVGPGQQLKAMMRRIDPEVFKVMKNVAA